MDSVVVATSKGYIVKYNVSAKNILPPDDPNQKIEMYTENRAAVTSMIMDDANVEGIIGTAMGNIYYVNI